MTNYHLNIENSETSLEEIDHNICLKKQYDASHFNVLTSVVSCASCGIKSSLMPLYGEICQDCAKHLLYDEY